MDFLYFEISENKLQEFISFREGLNTAISLGVWCHISFHVVFVEETCNYFAKTKIPFTVLTNYLTLGYMLNDVYQMIFVLWILTVY